MIERINPVELNPGQVSKPTKLIFHRYGDQYFLAQFWNLGSETGYEFPRSKAEREIGRQVAQPKTEDSDQLVSKRTVYRGNLLKAKECCE